MKSVTPKQFLQLEGKPVLMHTISRFHDFDNDIGIILVLPRDHMTEWRRLVLQHGFSIRHEIAEGGEERFHSVSAGLEMVDEDSLVAIHDGVRPLVSRETIWRCFADAEEFGNAVPCIEPADSIRLQAEDTSKPFPRGGVRLIQTPQVFRSSLIKEAYRRPYDPSFTDDATVAEASGAVIHLTHGNRENIKITTPEDMIIAGVLLGAVK